MDALAPKILTTQYGTYVWAAYDGTNRSGIAPLCDKVLVLCDQAAAQVGSLWIPDETKDKTGFAATSGWLVACGPQAFAYDGQRLVHWEGERPTPGQRVLFTKYAGLEYMGRDGLMYRVMDDRAIGAVELPEESPIEMPTETY